MGNKVFVSYKYKDYGVENLPGNKYTKVRDYVDLFQNVLKDADHIFKGEDDGTDLSYLSDDEIWESLKDRIYDSSVTIVFISPNMKDNNMPERNQWIPWEISYSLKETSRKNDKGDAITSKTNAILAVVLPDLNGKYDYYIVDNVCCSKGCRTLKSNQLFTILRENMFNLKEPDRDTCINGSVIYHGECSFIPSVKWKDFINNHDYYIKEAIKCRDNIGLYEISKDLQHSH